MTSEVTQEARNAAADLLHEVGCLLGDDGIGQVADLIRDGEYDDHDATIAFAKFERETIARMNAKPSDDKAIMRELRPSKAAMEKIERMEQANAAGLAEIRNMPFGGAAQSGEGRSGAGEDEIRVPREPTDDMVQAGLYQVGVGGDEWAMVYQIWVDMFDSLTLDGGCTQSLPAALNARQSGEGGNTLQHVAYYDEGAFHWMSGIAPRNCELYAAWPAALRATDDAGGA